MSTATWPGTIGVFVQNPEYEVSLEEDSLGTNLRFPLANAKIETGSSSSKVPHEHDLRAKTGCTQPHVTWHLPRVQQMTQALAKSQQNQAPLRNPMATVTIYQPFLTIVSR